MRERLVAVFVALAVIVLVVAAGLRLIALQELLRDETRTHLEEHAVLVAAVLDERQRHDEPITERVLGRLVDENGRLELVEPDGSRLAAEGPGWVGSDEDDVSSSADSLAGRVVLTQAPPSAISTYGRDWWPLLTLGLLMTLLAGLMGWWIAARLSAPFLQLAGAAAALGRGRFDLTLPDTRVPEARAIGAALKVSAAQLEARIKRERDFAEHASHVLRTPLTGLRLELEDLTLRDDVPDDVKEVAVRCMKRVESVDASAGELVAMTRGTSLVEGAETSLEDLAHQVTQLWADQLVGRRQVSAAVEGDLALRLTPGPMEHLLDLVLTDVKRGRGPARLVFVGEENLVRVKLTGQTVPGGAAQRSGVAAARAVAEAQGGRVSEHPHERDVEILLPRR